MTSIVSFICAIYNIIMSPLQDIEAKLRKRDDKFEYGPSSKVEFDEKNKISLNIPTSILCDGWSMKCLNTPLVLFL